MVLVGRRRGPFVASESVLARTAHPGADPVHVPARLAFGADWAKGPRSKARDQTRRYNTFV
jgi:hypothetical protein